MRPEVAPSAIHATAADARARKYLQLFEHMRPLETRTLFGWKHFGFVPKLHSGLREANNAAPGRGAKGAPPRPFYARNYLITMGSCSIPAEGCAEPVRFWPRNCRFRPETRI